LPTRTSRPASKKTRLLRLVPPQPPRHLLEQLPLLRTQTLHPLPADLVQQTIQLRRRSWRWIRRHRRRLGTFPRHRSLAPRNDFVHLILVALARTQRGPGDRARSFVGVVGLRGDLRTEARTLLVGEHPEVEPTGHQTTQVCQ